MLVDIGLKRTSSRGQNGQTAQGTIRVQAKADKFGGAQTHGNNGQDNQEGAFPGLHDDIRKKKGKAKDASASPLASGLSEKYGSNWRERVGTRG